MNRNMDMDIEMMDVMDVNDVSMMDWQAIPPALEINAKYNQALLERRRSRDDFEIPNMPGAWVDHSPARLFNHGDVIPMQHPARPSIITCAKQAVGQAKRRCFEVAATALQAPIFLYTMAQNTKTNIASVIQYAHSTSAPTVNQIVRAVRRAQADRRRRPVSPRISSRQSPRQRARPSSNPITGSRPTGPQTSTSSLTIPSHSSETAVLAESSAPSMDRQDATDSSALSIIPPGSPGPACFSFMSVPSPSPPKAPKTPASKSSKIPQGSHGPACSSHLSAHTPSPPEATESHASASSTTPPGFPGPGFWSLRLAIECDEMIAVEKAASSSSTTTQETTESEPSMYDYYWPLMLAELAEENSSASSTTLTETTESSASPKNLPVSPPTADLDSLNAIPAPTPIVPEVSVLSPTPSKCPRVTHYDEPSDTMQSRIHASSSVNHAESSISMTPIPYSPCVAKLAQRRRRSSSKSPTLSPASRLAESFEAMPGKFLSSPLTQSSAPKPPKTPAHRGRRRPEIITYPTSWLHTSPEYRYVELNQPPQTPLSLRTAAERQILADLVAASPLNEVPYSPSAGHEDPFIDQRAHVTNTPQYPPPELVETHVPADDAATLHDTTDFSSNVPFSPELMGETDVPAHVSYTPHDTTDFSSNVPFSPELVKTDVPADDAATLHDTTDFSSNVPFSPELVGETDEPAPVSNTPHDTTDFFNVFSSLELVGKTDEPVPSTPHDTTEFSSNVPFSPESPHDAELPPLNFFGDLDEIDEIDKPSHFIDTLHDANDFSSYIDDFPLDAPSEEWYEERAPSPYHKPHPIYIRRTTRSIARAEAEAQARKEEQTRKNLERAKISALSAHWEQKVEDAVRNGFAPDYTAADFARVVPPQQGRFTDNWLNDESVNGYLKIATKYHNLRHPSPIPKSHAFPSFMLKQIAEKGYAGVQRWAKRAKIGGTNLLETHTIFIPVNSGSHWTLMVVYPGARYAHYYDSLGRNRVDNGRHWFNLVKIWLRGELGDAYNDREWSFSDAKSPQQDNSSDCGVFAVTTAKMLVLGADVLGYGPEDIPLQRKRIVAELVNGDFL